MNTDTSIHDEHLRETLRTRLHALPQATPDADTWLKLRARVQSRKSSRTRLRRNVPLALAAGIVLALGLGHALHTDDASHIGTTPPRAMPARTGEASQASLPALQNRSLRLERWLDELRAYGAPLQGSTLARAMALQDRIGLVDLQLSAPGAANERRTLWQQRIRLLQELAMLRATQSPLAGQPLMAERHDASTYRL